MPYRVYDGYGGNRIEPDEIYGGYGSMIRNPALPPDYDGYGGFWNRELDPNWIPPEEPAAPVVAAPAPAPEAPAPAPVAPPVAEPAPVAPAAPVVDPRAPLGPAISAGVGIDSGLQPQTTGSRLAQTMLKPNAGNTAGSINITK